LPTLALTKDSLSPVGMQVLVYGYPEPVSNNLFLAAETGIEPSLTTGIVSAIKKTVYGWPVIQVDAMTSQGNSGGPVCNERGEVIGIISFGSIENSTGGLASGFNFAIPVAVVNEFIESSKTNPRPGNATSLFNEAIHLFYKQYYRMCLQKLLELKEVNSNYPQLYFYIRRCKQKIAAGEDTESLLWKYFLYLLTALLIGAVYFYFRRKKK
jgi:hypothetical protein